MQNKVNLQLTEDEILAITFALSTMRELSFRGCTPHISYEKLSDKIEDQFFNGLEGGLNHE